MLAQGFAYLQQELEVHNGRRITYRRGDVSLIVKAVIGEDMADAQDLGGFLVQTRSADFIICQDALSQFGKPQRNDVILYEINGQTHRFLVNAESTQSSHYRDIDGYGLAWRIHTIRDEIIGN